MEKEATRSQINLPPGFRFYPTDEELVVHYLCKRAASQPFAVPVIAEMELYKFDPWDLPGKALFGEKEWYFFSPRDRKYPNGSRPNRAAGSGYWKATGTDKPVTSGGGRKVGVKKSLVFYKGRAPKGVKTNWIMHEYCLADSAIRAQKTKGSVRLDDWVLCRVYEKIYGVQKDAMAKECNVRTSCKEDVLASLPETDVINPQINVPRINSLNRISSLKSAMQYNHKFIQNAMQINHAAYNVSDRQFSNDSVSTNSVIRPASTKNNKKEKERHSNGSIDSNTAIMVTEAGSYGINTIENQNLYLGSGVPTLMQMGSRVERPWMSTDTMAEEVVQISDSQLRRLPSIQRPFRLNGDPLIQSSFSQLQSFLSLGDDDALFATL